MASRGIERVVAETLASLLSACGIPNYDPAKQLSSVELSPTLAQIAYNPPDSHLNINSVAKIFVENRTFFRINTLVDTVDIQYVVWHIFWRLNYGDFPMNVYEFVATIQHYNSTTPGLWGSVGDEYDAINGLTNGTGIINFEPNHYANGEIIGYSFYQ